MPQSAKKNIVFGYTQFIIRDLIFFPLNFRYLLSYILFLVWVMDVSAQDKPKSDTIRIQGDIETTIEYYAEDSIVTDLETGIVYLYGKAKITYGNIKLSAAQIEINQRTNTVSARGTKDSLGRYRNTPIFSQDGDSYEADSMRYNFKSQKGVISGIVTKQGEGFIVGEKAKKSETGEMYAQNGKYTTCNLKHPHWYIKASKIKMIPEKQVVAGPFNLVIADVPTPLGFAFGIFPFIDKRRSGLIVPVYGESDDRGFFLRNGGYYWSINEYMAFTFLGEIYTNGSWGLQGELNYKSRYKYNGSASVQFNRRYQGEENERVVFQDFWIRWNHSPVSRGKSTFSASVNFGSARFNQRNNFNLRNQLSNNFSSSINYNTSFNLGNLPVTLGLSARQDQNSQTSVMNVELPSINLAINRIYPFKRADQTAKNFIQRLNLAYSFNGGARFTNQPLRGGFPFRVANERPIERDEEGQEIVQDFNFKNFSRISRDAQIGGAHNIPISTTVKLFNYISLNPAANISLATYPQKLDYTWDETRKAVRVDTIKKLTNVYSFSASASFTTRIYGTFIFNKKNRNARIQAIRHIITPTVGWSYMPDLSAEKYGFYQNVQVDSTGRILPVSRFIGFSPSAPISINESGVITFSLQNNFEMKVRPKGDTAKPVKITLLDNLSFAGSYNMVADSLKLSLINIAARTKLLKFLDFNFTGTLDPYQYVILGTNSDGSIRQTVVDKLLISDGKGIGQLRNFNISLGASFTPESFRKTTQGKAKSASNRLNTGKNDADVDETTKQILQDVQNNPEQYVDFDIPWTLSASYNLSYQKVGFQEATLNHQINFNGDISLTKTWKIGFTSGYDLTLQKLSTTNVNIYKDLHCWELRFDWNPFGTFQYYAFTLGIKSSLLQDLKLTRNRTFYDRDLIR